MKRRRMFLAALALGLLLSLAAVVTQAQGPERPEGEVGPQGDADATAVGAAIPVQGRLTDSGGNPLDGTYDLTFSLYENSSGGTALCHDIDSVDVNDGLFTAYVNGCSSSDINGRQLYLGISVETDPEMTPRQPIYPVPYAWSLRPGATISDTRDIILSLRSTGTGDSDVLIADAAGTGEAIEAYARDGVGVFALSHTYVALQAYSYDNTDHPAVFGCSADEASDCDGFRDDGPAGVFGYGTPGVMGQADWGYGVLGKAGIFGAGVRGEGNLLSYAGWFTNTGQTVLLITSGDEDSNNAILVQGGGSEADFRVTNEGTAYADGGWQGAADFAELVDTEGDSAAYEPGDVLVISTASDRMVALSSTPFSTAVMGIYSESPGFVGSPHVMEDQQDGEIPVAIVGIVPCKVSAENGPIQRGDLLVTASTFGHAMRAGDSPRQGTVLGKALGTLQEGTGVIDILVTLQ
jgi:hypothetical protein